MISKQIIYHHRIKKIASKILQSPLVADNFIYLSVYKRIVAGKMKQLEKSPLRLMVENTNICNANCIFCPHQKMKRKAGVMSMRLFKKIVGEGKGMGIKQLTLHGFGEPFLDKAFFKKVKYAKDAGISLVSTNTNGMYLTKEKIDSVFASGLDEIYISFDALGEQTYRKIRPGLDFSTVEKNILALIEQKRKRGPSSPKIVLSFVESVENAAETKKYLEKWRDKVDNISVSFLHNWAGSVGRDKTSGQGKKDPCRLLWTDLIISWNGDVPLCCNDYENKIILGNVSKRTLKEIWSGEKLKRIRELHQKKLFNEIAICKDCDLNYHNKLPWWGL